jgi:hypothetical protein
MSQNEKYFEGFERQYMKIYLEWLEMPCIGIYYGLFGITWFLGVGCMRSIPSQYRFLASKAG